MRQKICNNSKNKKKDSKKKKKMKIQKCNLIQPMKWIISSNKFENLNIKMPVKRMILIK